MSRPELCAECNMPLGHPGEYHPFAACLMFKACHNSEVVRSNLGAVVDFGRDIGRSEHQCVLPAGIVQALNEGDGVYRP